MTVAHIRTRQQRTSGRNDEKMVARHTPSDEKKVREYVLIDLNLAVLSGVQHLHRHLVAHLTPVMDLHKFTLLLRYCHPLWTCSATTSTDSERLRPPPDTQRGEPADVPAKAVPFLPRFTISVPTSSHILHTLPLRQILTWDLHVFGPR